MFTTNKDFMELHGLPLEQATGGESVSGIAAFDRAYEANARASATFAVPHAVEKEQERINEDLKNAGEEPIPKTWYMATYDGELGPDLNAVTSIDETGRELSNSQRSVVEYNKRILSLREKHPDLDLPLVGEQFDRVKKKAEDARLRQEKTTYSGVGGYIGAFAGQLAADMNPFLNPVNTVTLGLGGVGKTIATRVASEAGLNAGASLLNDLTGVNYQRRVLGLPEATAGEMLAGAAVAGLGAGVIRGAAEGVGVLAKRWFPDVPELAPMPDMLRPGEVPPAHLTPEQRDFVVARQKSDAEMNANPDINARTVTQDSLFGNSRLAEAHFEEDMAHVERAFNNGEDILPPRVDAQGRTPDALAREIDPDTFRMYDRIREEQAKIRADIERQIAYERRVNGEPSDITKANIQEKREYIQFLDERARDLTPSMGRAYARAENEWTPSAATKEAVDGMVARGERVLPERTAKSPRKSHAYANPVSEENKALVERYGGRSTEETATKALTRATTKALDEGDNALDKTLAELEKTLDEGRLPEGLPEGVGLDKELPLGPVDENGNATKVTLREFFQDSLDDERAMKAVSVCQINS